jgi:hypothetical protein
MEVALPLCWQGWLPQATPAARTRLARGRC